MIFTHRLPCSEWALLRPPEINKTLPSFRVARDFVLFSTGLQYSFDMEHPVYGANSPCSSTLRHFAVSQQEFILIPVHSVEIVDVCGSLTRFSTTGGYHRERQENRVYNLHEVLDGLGNQKGKGGVVVIRANPLAFVRVTRPITSKPMTAVE